MKVLVTGASGAIGSNLSKALIERGDQVISIEHDIHPIDSASVLGVKDKITWATGDIVSETFVKRVISDYEVDLVYHLAALPIVRTGAKSIRPVYEVNLMGTLSILEALKEQTLSGTDIPLVYVATDKVYGPIEWGRAYRESDPLLANSPYETSKACADMTVRMYNSMGFVKYVATVRPSNQFGPGDMNSRVIPNTIRRCLQGKSPILYKGITYVREFTYFEDTCRAFMSLGDNIRDPRISGEAFNLGSGDTADQEGVVCEILTHFPGLEAEWREPEKYTRKEIPYQALDHSKLTQRTSWRAMVPFEEGIARTVAWWKVHPELWHIINTTNVAGSPNQVA